MDLEGWALTDGGDIHVELSGRLLAGAYFLLERTDDETVSDIAADALYTGSLGNNGETLTLADGAGGAIDIVNPGGGMWPAGDAPEHCSMERRSSSAWVTNDNLTRSGLDAAGQPICGTPRRANSPGRAPTRTATATARATATTTRTPSASAEPTLSPTPSLTATAVPGQVYINEFLPAPASDWDSSGAADQNDEWVELYNANDFEVDVSGWQLDDVEGGGSTPFRLATGTLLSPRGMVVLYRGETGIALNQTNDDVRLLAPNGAEVDKISYKSSEPDASWARIPDGAAYFALDCPPTPGTSNCSRAPSPTPTATPFAERVVVNEFLAAPYADWNRDDVLDSNDEWIELYNGASAAVDLSGWMVDDGKQGSGAFELPADTVIGPKSFLVLYGDDTHVGLNNDGDAVRLLHPDGTPADRMSYEPLTTNASMGRYPDGRASWVRACIPTPGEKNCSRQVTPAPTPTLDVETIAAARARPDGSVVTVRGTVVAHPCELDIQGHALVLADDAAGIEVYLSYPNRFSCLIPRGEPLIVTGVLGSYHGLRTLYPRTPLDLIRHAGPPQELAARRVRADELGEAFESMPVRIEGTVSNGKSGTVLWVNDGTGIARVEAHALSGVSFEGITRGSVVEIAGLVYQYDAGDGDAGYSLRPRDAADVVVLELADRVAPTPRTPRRTDLGAIRIAQARTARAQSLATLSGMVTAPPGVFGEREFWIEDESGGLRVYVTESAGPLPQLALGDAVRLRGRIVSSFGAPELHITEATGLQVEHAGEVRPRLVSIAGLESEGRLIALDGRITAFRGRELELDDGTGTIVVYVDAGTHIRYGSLQRGDWVRVTGIVTRFQGELELLPRFQSDLVLNRGSGAPLQPARASEEAPQSVGTSAGVGDALPGRVRSLVGFAAARVPAVVRAAPVPVSIAGDNPVWLPDREVANALLLGAWVLLAASGAMGIVAAGRYRKARHG